MRAAPAASFLDMMLLAISGMRVHRAVTSRSAYSSPSAGTSSALCPTSAQPIALDLRAHPSSGSSTRKPGMDSSLSSVPPVWPRPRPDILTNAAARRRHQRHEHDGRLVAHAAGAVLVHRGAVQVAASPAWRRSPPSPRSAPASPRPSSPASRRPSATRPSGSRDRRWRRSPRSSARSSSAVSSSPRFFRSISGTIPRRRSHRAALPRQPRRPEGAGKQVVDRSARHPAPPGVMSTISGPNSYSTCRQAPQGAQATRPPAR